MKMSVASSQDILCQFEGDNLPSDLLTVTVVEVRGNLANLTITIPVSLIQSFQSLFNSFLEISNHVKRQLHISQAIDRSRSAVQMAEQKINFQKLLSKVVKKYDAAFLSGLTSRQAIRKTQIEMKEIGSTLNCYQIELIVRQAGRLSKRRNKGNDEKRKEKKKE